MVGWHVVELCLLHLWRGSGWAFVSYGFDVAAMCNGQSTYGLYVNEEYIYIVMCVWLFDSLWYGRVFFFNDKVSG